MMSMLYNFDQEKGCLEVFNITGYLNIFVRGVQVSRLPFTDNLKCQIEISTEITSNSFVKQECVSPEHHFDQNDSIDENSSKLGNDSLNCTGEDDFQAQASTLISRFDENIRQHSSLSYTAKKPSSPPLLPDFTVKQEEEKPSKNSKDTSLPSQVEERLATLREHIDQKSFNLEVSCKYCFLSFKDKDEFVNHFKVKDPKLDPGDKKLYTCCICQKSLTTMKTLMKHCESQHPPPKATEEWLNETLPDAPPKVVKKSRKRKTTVEKRPKGTHDFHTSTCKTCGFVSNNVSEFRIHTASHRRECPYCDVQCITPAQVLRHVQEIHPDKVQYCKCCNRGFTTAKARDEHERMAKYKRYKRCHICNELCSNIRSHMQSKHSTDRPVCHVCGKSFLNQVCLRSHFLNFHAEKKSFKCDMCEKTFPTRLRASKHMLRVHLWKNRHQCTICGKLTNTMDNLKTHMRIHSETKLFQCPYCSKEFNYKPSLTSHLEKHHPESQLNQDMSQDIKSRLSQDMSSLSQPLNLNQSSQPLNLNHSNQPLNLNQSLQPLNLNQPNQPLNLNQQSPNLMNESSQSHPNQISPNQQRIDLVPSTFNPLHPFHHFSQFDRFGLYK